MLACALCVSAACGGDDDDGAGVDAAPTPDAAGEPDAGFAALCLGLDSECGYTPEEVTPDDISLADQLAIAERFNPAHVMTDAHLWPVSIDYLLGSALNGLEQAEHGGRINFSYDVDETTRQAVSPQPDLLNDNWSNLPLTTGDGADLVYFADAPGDCAVDTDGDDTNGNGYDDESWSAGWVEAQGGSDADPASADYPPSQYAHFFWLSKDDALLAIQYWFYYPYDKWTNNHEGDWEHVNVIVRYRGVDDVVIEGAHFSHHGAQGAVHVDELIRLADRAGGDGDHLVVFTGGESCLEWVPSLWCGRASGASLPWPGTYAFNTPELVFGGADDPAGRYLHANDIDVVLLPRVVDVDFDARPNLSWYALPFIAGQPTIPDNATVVIGTENHRAPVSPGSEHDEYDVGVEQGFDYAMSGDPVPFDAPEGWNLIADPSQGF